MKQIYATFEHCVRLELAISALEHERIPKDRIFAVPLHNRKGERRLFDTMHQSDGVSFIGTGAAIGTALSVVGASVGFSLKWGPIYWGLIGAGAGFVIGFLIDLFFNTVIRKQQRRLRGKHPQVVLIVTCDDQQADTVEDILWHFSAFGVASVECQPEG
ncbi:hypothetical protein JI721_05085 [Alicyclobacillus cycloheptanicus]|uniref:Glycine zipper domain-containing protein n=1 Tax=Alicyclobacillus cycloheptanicus TaxID=1457 RepID=A0ABT9XIF7_9BACL|nr:hypothetical protein [Alicyclobacillus cycloheptanicus]MDQ0189905.1 hypothetical protein [Alicyclobacillus cycloheptanicus]WDM02191.1 hypothetical protein JI721_05085 [Alicyclobacillus cycloheptanicus]